MPAKATSFIAAYSIKWWSFLLAIPSIMSSRHLQNASWLGSEFYASTRDKGVPWLEWLFFASLSLWHMITHPWPQNMWRFDPFTEDIVAGYLEKRYFLEATSYIFTSCWTGSTAVAHVRAECSRFLLVRIVKASGIRRGLRLVVRIQDSLFT